jgi:hypothetical protein
MTLRQFVRENREEITRHIRAAGIRVPLNDEDRGQWIANDESLYLWAKSEGVEV